ncbi:MAG TPA: histidine kinase dimerization/phospho-acceptor domain-containing protein, partial [Chloroflexia bacterium]|nr:histidine kinase dimerization/phospho-acceptor domain-containing protein [Chloroflexia bacterium]
MPDAQEVLRASLHALLTSAQRVTSARGVALGVPTGTGTGVSVVQAVGGSDLVPGSTIDAGAVPGLRVLALPPVAAGYPRPNAVLLVLRGMVNLDEADPGAALPAALLALSAVVQAAQIQRRAAKGVTAAASPSPAGAPSPAPAPPDPDSILGRVARRVCELIGADLASVATKDATGTLVWRALAGYRSLLLHSGPVPPEARLVHAVAESGCAEVVMQIQHNAETRSMYPLLEREGVETAAGTPLCREDAVVGVLVVAWRTPHEVSADEERLLVSLADQVTAAMAQGQLAEESGRQRAFLERLIQHVPAGIIAFTVPDLRVSEVNPFYLQFLDEPFRSGARDLHGLPVTEFIPQVAESGLLDLFRRVATTGEPVTISEFEFTGFERGITYWDWSMVSLHDMEGGPVTGLLLLVAERTEAVLARRRLAAALAGARAQAAELDAVIQQMAEGVAITDPSGRLIKINAAGEALLGRGIVPLEPGGNYAEGYEIYDREGRPFDPARLPLERAAHGETVTGQDMVVHRPGGEECILSVSAAPLHGEAGAIQGAVAVFHDVTKAREVERLKDEFLSIVSHELRTPLAAILGYSDILLRKLGGPLTEKQEQTIESVRSNAKRLLGLINDLLDVSKLEAQGITLSPEPVLLQHAIPKALGWVQVLATARGVSLQHQVPVTLPAVWADEARLHQIITNLLSNAIKFTPTGGAVMVRAQLSTLAADAPAEQPESALAPTEGPSVRITVQDTGLGMAPDQLERIWDRFYQAESTSSRR